MQTAATRPVSFSTLTYLAKTAYHRDCIALSITKRGLHNMRKSSPIYIHFKPPNCSSTNYGQYRGSDRYTVSESYSYSLQQSPNSTQTAIPTQTPTPTSTLTTCYTPTTIPSPTCTHVTVPPGETWYVYFAGQGLTENTDNPGNVGYVPETVDFPGDLSACEAIQQCANAAQIYPGTAWSFDIHFLVIEQTWECVIYYDFNLNPGFFNVENCDVSQSYGYTVAGTNSYVPPCYGSNNPDCPEEPLP